MPGITPLTTGVLQLIMNGEEVKDPVLQVLGLKKIAGTDAERYRVLVSDGKYYNSFSMLATAMNHLQEDGSLVEFSIIQLKEFITSVVNKNEGGKRVLIMLDVKVLHKGDDVGRKIGDPISYLEAAQAQTSSKPAGGAGATGSKPKAEPKANLSTLHSSTNNNNNMSMSWESGYTLPINSLTPYQNKWVIKARVTSKSTIRTWSNAKGEGKLFSMDLMDQSGEIRATAFRDMVDKFYDLIEVNRVYFITKCQLKPANKQYTSLKNDYEMTFTSETMVKLCEDQEEEEGIPEIKYDLIPISEVANLEPKALADVIGVCKEAGELQNIVSRTTNKEFRKRDLTLVDESNTTVQLTLWGDDAANYEGLVQPVILVKGARVNEFNGGKSLSMGNGSVLKINPDVPECHKLRNWFDNGGAENVSTSLSARTGGGNFNTEWLTFYEARARNLGNGDKPDYFQCKALIHLVKGQNATYKACPKPECNKKVVDEVAGHFRCERCNAVYPNFKYRLLLNMLVGDWSANRWVTCFSDTAEQLLKRTAQEVGADLEEESVSHEEVFAPINFQSYIFKMRVKNEMFGDMTRCKTTIQSVAPINFQEYNKHLIDNLKELTGIGRA